MVETDFATLREVIKRKYDGNMIETDFATLREIIKWKYDGNMIETDFATLHEIIKRNIIEIDSACLPRAGEIDRNST